MNESRCDERLNARVEESTCLTYVRHASHTLGCIYCDLLEEEKKNLKHARLLPAACKRFSDDAHCLARRFAGGNFVTMSVLLYICANKCVQIAFCCVWELWD
jgi:hypothetical protein